MVFQNEIFGISGISGTNYFHPPEAVYDARAQGIINKEEEEEEQDEEEEEEEEEEEKEEKGK